MMYLYTYTVFSPVPWFLLSVGYVPLPRVVRNWINTPGPTPRPEPGWIRSSSPWSKVRFRYTTFTTLLLSGKSLRQRNGVPQETTTFDSFTHVLLITSLVLSDTETSSSKVYETSIFL